MRKAEGMLRIRGNEYCHISVDSFCLDAWGEWFAHLLCVGNIRREMMNIVSLAMNVLGPTVISKIAGSLGINNTLVTKAISVALPAILGGVAGRSKTHTGLGSLFNMLTGSKGNMLDSFAGMVGTDDQSRLMDAGRQDLASLLGDDALSSMSGAIGRHAGINQQQANSLLGLVGPVALGTLTSEVQRDGLDARGLANLLEGQQKNIAEAMPHSFLTEMSGSSVFGGIDFGKIGGAAAVASAIGGAASGVAARAGNMAGSIGDTARGAAGSVGSAASGAVDAAGNAISGAGNMAGNMAGSIGDTARGAAGSVGSAASGAVDAAGNAISGAGNMAGNVAGSIGDTARGAAGSVGSAASGAVDVAGNAISGAGNMAGNVAGSIGDTARGAAGSVGSAASGAVDAAGNAISGAGNMAGNMAGSIGDTARGAAGSVGSAASGAVDAAGNAISGAGNMAGNMAGSIGDTASVAVDATGRTISGTGAAIAGAGAVAAGAIGAAASSAQRAGANVADDTVEAARQTSANMRDETRRSGGGWGWLKWLIGLLLLAAIAWFVWTNFIAPTMKQSAGMEQSIVVGDTDIGAAFGSTIDTVKSSIGSITDEASARAALPDLAAANDTFDKIGGMVGSLGETQKGALSGVAGTAMETLRPMMQKAVDIPGVGPIVAPAMESMLGKLAAMAS